VTSLLERLEALEALVAAATDPPGGPAKRTAADYGAKGKGGGRKVATKAGEARYGLPIGTPLGKGNKALATDQGVAHAYDTFMSASTPAEQHKAAGWMSNDELTKAAKGLFSFDSKNERDVSGRLALVRELADRGIDPHTLGYTGPTVVLNPNPKVDPTVRAAQLVQKASDRAAKADQSAQTKAERARQAAEKKAVADARQAASDARQAAKDAASQKVQDTRSALAQAIAEGVISEKEAKRRMAGLK
jgi:hypothetical protein